MGSPTPFHADLYEPGNAMVKGALEVAGGITIGGSAVAVAPGVVGDGDDGLTISESLSVGEDIAATRDATVGRNLGVTGTGTFGAGGDDAPQIVLVPAAGTGAPDAGAHVAGELYLDVTGALFICTVAGTSGTWKTVTVS